MQLEMKKKEERDKEKKKKVDSLLKDYNFSETKLPKLVWRQSLSLTALTLIGLDFGTSSKVRLTNVI